MYHCAVKTWNSPAGRLQLKRFPFEGEQIHQAWDAADEWILNRLHSHSRSDRTVITGEAFGVLATALGSRDIIAVNDSFLSLAALDVNRNLNPQMASGPLQKITGETAAEGRKRLSPGELPGPRPTASAIIIRLPRSLEVLEKYLRMSLKYADPDTEIWLGGMDKRWNKGCLKIADRFMTESERFPFERHARWIKFTKPSANPVVADGTNKEALKKNRTWQTPAGIKIKPEPGVFSSRSLDPGTAAFLEAFPESETVSARIIADMGCGSGILGLTAARLNPEAEIILSDESYSAVISAAANAGLNGLGKNLKCITGNGLEGIEDESVDLVLCNPPFHYQNIQTREPAEFMFNEARRVLKPGGTLQVVGNNHLGYHKLLKKHFPDAREVLRDSRFTVMRSLKNS